MSQMLAPTVREPGDPPRAGYTRVSAQALTNTARAVAAEAFGVAPRLVRAFLRDDAGYLALSIQVPLPLADSLSGSQQTVLELVADRRAKIGARFSMLTGSLVSRVDVRITGVVDPAAGRKR